MGYAGSILRTRRRGSSHRAASARPPPVTVEPRIWYNPELRSTLFLVPGLIAYIAMITAVVSTALSIVREKERGTMEQVRMAPIDTFSFVVGKTIPYFLISLASAALIILARRWCCSGCRCAATGWRCSSRCRCSSSARSATGLLISTVADTQQVAFQMALLISFLPTMMLSGFIFPIASMPRALQLDHLRRAGALLPHRAARHRAEGHGTVSICCRSSLALSIYAARDARRSRRSGWRREWG